MYKHVISHADSIRFDLVGFVCGFVWDCQVHRELAALCVSKGYVLRFDGCAIVVSESLLNTCHVGPCRANWTCQVVSSSRVMVRFDRFESLPSGFRCVFRVEFAGPALETGWVKAWVSYGVLVSRVVTCCHLSMHLHDLHAFEASIFQVQAKWPSCVGGIEFSILKPRKHNVSWQDVVRRDRVPCSIMPECLSFLRIFTFFCLLAPFSVSLSFFLHVCPMH